MPNNETDRDFVVLNNLLFVGLRCTGYDFFETFGKFFNMERNAFMDSSTQLINIVNYDEIFYLDDALLALCRDDVNTLNGILTQQEDSGISHSISIYDGAIDIAISYTDLSALSGSVECFKYLTTNFQDIKPTEASMQIALIGGNTDIIHNVQKQLGNDYHIGLVSEAFGLQGISDCEILKFALSNDIVLNSYKGTYTSMYILPNIKGIKTLLEENLFNEKILLWLLSAIADSFRNTNPDLATYDYVLKFLKSNVSDININNVVNELSCEIGKLGLFQDPQNPVFKLLKKYGIYISPPKTFNYDTWFEYLPIEKKAEIYRILQEIN